MKIKQLTRTTLAAAAIALAATVIVSAPAAARDHGGRGDGPRYSDGGYRGKDHGFQQPGSRRYYRQHRHFRRYQRRHRHFRPRHGGYGYRYGRYVPAAVIMKTLIHGQGYRTVGKLDYRPAGHFKGYGPAYRDGAFVAIAYRPNGAYRIHLNPYSGAVIKVAFTGRR